MFKAACPGNSGFEIPPMGPKTLGNGDQRACGFRGARKTSKIFARDGVWEWDVLSIYHMPTARSPKFGELTPEQGNDGMERELVISGVGTFKPVCTGWVHIVVSSCFR